MYISAQAKLSGVSLSVEEQDPIISQGFSENVPHANAHPRSLVKRNEKFVGSRCLGTIV